MINKDHDKSLVVGLVGPLPPPFGGMANQTRQLHKLLEDEGIQVHLVQTNPEYPNRFIAKLKGVRAVIRLFDYVVRVWKLTGRVDLIHVMSNSGWSWQLFSAPVLWIAWLKKTPVIINYRGGEALTYFQKSFSRIRPSLNKTSAIVVPSGYLQSIFAEFSVTTQVIPNIIDLERFKPAQRKPDLKSPHLVVTRNLEPIYGIETAIRAMGLVKQKIPEIKLSIAGSGEQLNELQSLVKQLGLHDQIVFTGKLNPDQIVQLYHSADILLNPTTVDNMPNSLLEAMACGIPIITTDVGGIPYIVKDKETALFTPVDNPALMATQICKLLASSELYNHLREQALKEVKQYAWNEVKRQWLSIYSKYRK